MQKLKRRTACQIGVGLLSMLLAVVGWNEILSAAEIRLKNGTILRGEFLVMKSLSGRAVGTDQLNQAKDADPVPHNIGRVDTGWQRVYFPLQQRQVLEGDQASSLVTANPVVIPLPRPKRTGQGMIVSSVGTILDSTPFDEFGRRRLVIATAKENKNVFQSITQVTPDHIMVESTNCEWKLGLPLQAVAQDVLDKMLKKQIASDDPVARFALVTFYSQADYYPQAFAELDEIERDFTDRKELVDKSREELMNYFGSKILKRLVRRRRAGQHQLAEAYAGKLLSQPLSGAVLQNVKAIIQNYEQGHQSVEHAKLLLSNWQSRLNDPAIEAKLPPLRSEINEQLGMITLPRLDAFLKAESDKQYEPSERLALAYSGWVLGSANAIPDLTQTLRIWEARNLLIDALRSEDLGIQAEKLDQLRSLESVSPQTVLNLVPQLPPILDDSEVTPDSIEVVSTAAHPDTQYSVVLPTEYSRLHNYPLLVVLRNRNRTIEQTLHAWAGDSSSPDLGSQRGYIVIAPHYADENQGEHSYGSVAHNYVLDCLIDARKRFAVDSDQVFLAGHGMGADAAFDIGLAHPDEFAGVLPIGGKAVTYCNFTWQNGSQTAWYIVGRGYDSKDNRDHTSNQVLDAMLIRGGRYDVMLTEYLGRNGENLFDDSSKLFDWMDLHVRRESPKDFEMRSLRKSDNRFFWVTATGLLRDYILPAPSGTAQRVVPMVIDASITPGNTLVVKAPADQITVRLTPELVDFEKRLVLKIGGKSETIFLKPDVAAVVDELRQRGDRKRLPLVVITR